MAKHGRWIPLACLAFAWAACDRTKLEELFDRPDTNPVRKVLKVTMPLAYAANLTRAALDGDEQPNVRFVTSGDPRRDPFLVEITVDDRFPLPQGIRATGVIRVAGLVTRDSVGHPDFLLLTVVFSQLDVAQGSFTIQDVTAMPVVVDRDVATGQERLYAVYAHMDVDAGSSADPLLSVQLTQQDIDVRYRRNLDMREYDYEGRTVVEQDTWILTVDDHGTPGDPADDTYWVGGAQQYLDATSGSADVMQLLLLLAMKPSCKANPLDGGGFIQAVGSGSDLEVGHVLLGVTGRCDGRMKFLLGTGSYVLLTDQTFALHLDE